MAQIKEAMSIILGELYPDDTFSIIEFSSAASVWDVEKGKLIYRNGASGTFNYFEYPGEPVRIISFSCHLKRKESPPFDKR